MSTTNTINTIISNTSSTIQTSTGIKKSPSWGQLVCGPPGSGKSTYCAALCEFLNNAGRPTIIVNLDPANEQPIYKPTISIQDLITVEDVGDTYGLGPNGSLMYCLEFLEHNVDWLAEHLRDEAYGFYVLFDCPGQAELYTHHESFAKIVKYLKTTLDYRLAAVHLVDAHYCSDPSKFIAASLLSLTAMIRLELPHINVLSKLDLIKAYGRPGMYKKFCFVFNFLRVVFMRSLFLIQNFHWIFIQIFMICNV
jgi:GPN-loop GTPase